MKKYLLIIALIFIYSCTEHKSSSSSRYQDTEYEESEDYDEDEDSIEEEEGYPDGTYDATIRVYNPNTGHNATYTLEVEVEVENEELTKIYWNNGGWLDDSHFSPADISDGTASFTDDRGYEYRVELD